MGATLMEKYRKWLSHCEEGGIPLTDYRCPDCSEIIITSAPEFDEYSSLTVCPFCENIHFKVVDAEGAVDVIDDALEEAIQGGE